MSNKEKHFVVVIPGLGDDRPLTKFMVTQLTRHWENYGLEVVIHTVGWTDQEPFEPKLQRVLNLIDSLAAQGRVSIVGTSAGATMAFNAFGERKSVVHKAVNDCGRLRAGNHRVRSLENKAKLSPAFKQAVLRFEKIEPSLTKQDRRRLMTIRPFFGDELVPRDTACLEGAVNRWVYTPEHMFSIGMSLIFAQPIISFLRETHT